MIRETEPTDEGGEYYFDELAASMAVAFFPRYLKHFKGKWAGQSFELDADWQVNIVRNVFGWKRKSDGTRRYRVVYIWVPRKNGKSTLAAGFGFIMLLGDGEPGSEVYLLARTGSQARIVYSFMGQMIDQSPELSSILTPFKTSIWCDQLSGKVEPLTGKPAGKHGLNANGIVGDEIHEWADDELYTFVHQSEGTRDQPLDFLISTAGKRDGVGWEHFQLCEAILEGEVYAPDTYIFIASADPVKADQDPDYWKSEEASREANPGYGKSVKPEFLRDEVAKATSNPRRQNDVMRYYLNLWVDQSVRWLDMSRWDKCGHADDEPPPPMPDVPLVYRKANFRWQTFREKFQGRRCLAGIDLSSTVDLTCRILVFPPDSEHDRWCVIPHFYLPRGDEDDMKDRIKRDKFDYLAAEKIGAITLTDGDVVDYDKVYKDHVADGEMFQIEATGIDRWNATGMATRLEKIGMEVALYGQGFASMSGPSKFLERIVMQQRLDHGGHPVLRWNARNVAIKKDESENIKPVKDDSTGRIDGITGLITGIGVSDDYMDDSESVYEQRGLR